MTAEERASDPSPRPVFDGRQGTLLLPRRLVPAALLLLEGTRPTSSVPGLEALEAAGVTVDGRVHRSARRILGPVAAPSAVVSVETSVGDIGAIGTIWSRAGEATVGTSDRGLSFLLRAIDAGLIPFHLAAIVSMGMRPQRHRQPVTVRPEGPGAAPTSPTATRLLGTGARRWRVSTLWSEPDGLVGDRVLEVVDAGDDGYWQVTTAADAVLLTPRTVDDILRLLAAASPAHPPLRPPDQS